MLTASHVMKFIKFLNVRSIYLKSTKELSLCHKQGRIQGGKGAVPSPRPVKGGVELRAITLFKSEIKK